MTSPPATQHSVDDDGPGGWQGQFPPITYWVKVGGVIIGIIGVLRLLAILQGVLIVLAASMVLAIGLQPAIGWFQRHNAPRVVAVGAILISGLAVGAAAAFLIIPIVIDQVTTLVQTLPDYIDGLAQDSPIIANITQRLDPLDNAGAAMGQLPEGALAAVGTAFKTLFDLLLVLTLTPYFALSLPKAKRWAVRLLVRGDRDEALHLLNRSTSLMANYIAGNLLVSVIAGTITFVGLKIIGVPYAAALAVFVALTDLIPAVGATVGAAAVLAVAATQGIPQLLSSVVLTVGYQQFENFVIVPRVMREAIDVQPATGIVALLVGGTLAGPIGALLALPVTAMGKLLVEEFFLRDRVATVRSADADEERARGARRRPSRPRRQPLP